MLTLLMLLKNHLTTLYLSHVYRKCTECKIPYFFFSYQQSLDRDPCTHTVQRPDQRREGTSGFLDTEDWGRDHAHRDLTKQIVVKILKFRFSAHLQMMHQIKEQGHHCMSCTYVTLFVRNAANLAQWHIYCLSGLWKILTG
jgi:hypothetical protein